jgi:hypothetical protein
VTKESAELRYTGIKNEMFNTTGARTTRVEGLYQQLRKYVKNYTKVCGSSPSLTEEEAIAVLQNMHHEVYQLFIDRLCQFYMQSWKEYQVDPNTTMPDSCGVISELCAKIVKEVRDCVRKERVSFNASKDQVAWTAVTLRYGICR